MIKHFKKRKALKNYVKHLPLLLNKGYGRSDYYTVGQVRSTIENNGFDSSYITYAYAIYLQKDKFIQLGLGDVEMYQTLRKEIGEKYFRGNSEFNISDMNFVSGVDNNIGESD